MRDLIAYCLCGITVIIVSLPIVAFTYLSLVEQYPVDLSLSLKHIYEAFALNAGTYLKNSLAIALSTAFVGVCITYFIAYLTARTKRCFSNLMLHLVSMASLAIPGIVLGLSYVLAFKESPIYGTIMVLILVNTVHFFASPYLLAYNSLSKFNKNLEDVSETLGISKWKMIKDVYIPCTNNTIIEMFCSFFVNSMVTISAVSFLANFRNMPVALMIPMFDSQSLIEATAFISMLILAINGFMKFGVYIVKRKFVNLV